jgi:hypothetical protein
MSDGGGTVRRILHFKFTLPAADPQHLLTLVKASAPFLEVFGGKSVRLLQNVDDPARFVQVIDYETDESMELNRQRIASDPRVQTYLQTWRAILPGAVEIDVYQDVANSGSNR